MKEKTVPLRMCIACREMKEKYSMLRIVKNDLGISIDFSGKASGRGAYICDRVECIEKLQKQRLLNRTFSTDVPMEVYQRIKEEFLEKQ